MRAQRNLVRVGVRTHWRESLGVALLLAMSVGVVLVAAAGARRTDTAYDRLLRSTDAADANVTVASVAATGNRQNFGALAGFYTAAAALPDVSVLAPIRGVDARLGGPAGTPVLLKAAADSRMFRSIERPRLTAGRMADPDRADEVVVDRTAAARFHLHVGDRVNLVLGPLDAGSGVRAARAVRVVGIGVTRENVLPVTQFANELAFLATPALFHATDPSAVTYDSAFVRLDRGASLGTFRRQLQALVRRYPDTGGQLFVVDERQQAREVSRGIRPQAVALALFALLTAITTVLVMGQILVRQVYVAANDHPTLRALGLRRAQLAGACLAEVGITIAVGTIGAVVAAVVLSQLMPIGPARIAEPHPGVAADWTVLGLGALATILVFALRVAPSVWRLAGPNLGTTPSLPPRLLARMSRAGAPVTVDVGARLALDPGRGRSAVPTRTTLAGAAVALVALTGAVTFGANLVRLVETPRLYGQSWQISADRAFDTFTGSDTTTFLRDRPGVAGWTFGNHTEPKINGQPTAGIELTAGRGPASFPTLLEGRSPRRSDEIVLGTKTMSRAHAHVGDVIAVAPHDGDAPRSMHVVGRAVFPSFGQGEVTPTGLGDGAALLASHADQEVYNFVLVRVTNGPRQAARIGAVGHDLERWKQCVGDCTVATTQRPTDVDNFARVERTPLILGGVLALFAVASVAHLLFTSVSRRRRDLAILKLLGFTRGQVSRAVTWQATITVSLALIVGIPIGVVVGRQVWHVFATQLGVAADAHVPLLAVLVCVPVALVVAVAVAVVPAARARRLHSAGVLRAE
jgi:hypothetical protein